MSFRMSITITAVVVICYLWTASVASAKTGPIELVSKSATEQAVEARESTISADDRYVAFTGVIDGLKGIFRKDLQTGALVPVAAGPAGLGETELSRSTGPSISSNGRYVSFTTAAQLDPVDDTSETSEDVYVADMSTEPPTYELASALDGCNPDDPLPHAPCGITYAGAGRVGSEATAGVSLSADGSVVVFVTTAASNLLGEEGGTPAFQVVARDLRTDATTLVSDAYDPKTGQMAQPPRPIEGGAVLSQAPEASVSGDGSTVAWLGVDLPQQVPLTAAEKVPIENPATYTEPLLRRIATGPAAPTVRILGGPGAPFNGLATGELGFGLGCAGELKGWDHSFNGPIAPALSADGTTVALVGQSDGYADAYLVKMKRDDNGPASVQRLTRAVPLREPCDAATVPGTFAGSAGVESVAISPDGSRVAFTTVRQQFPSAFGNLVTSPPSSLGLPEVYRIRLDENTLERVTHGTSGSEPSRAENPEAHGAESVSFSGDGATIAFASGASNLVAGDSNEASDVYVQSEVATKTERGNVAISAPPAGVRVKPRRRLTASGVSMPSGAVRIAVVVPEAGSLRARATARVGTHARAVAVARHRVGGRPLVFLFLRPRRRYHRLIREPGGLEANARITFTSHGEKPLRASLGVRFRPHARKHRKGGSR